MRRKVKSKGAVMLSNIEDTCILAPVVLNQVLMTLGMIMEEPISGEVF